MKASCRKPSRLLGRFSRRSVVILMSVIAFGFLGGMFFGKDAYAETTCYRLKISQNGNPYHSNAVCRDDSGNITVPTGVSGNGLFTFFRENDEHVDGPSICLTAELIDQNLKRGVCRQKAGLDLNGTVLIDMIKEECGESKVCKVRNSSNNMNYNVIVEDVEQVSEDQLGEAQNLVPVDDPNADAGHPKSTDDACREGSAMFSLGWFLCPIMDMVTGAVGDLYDSVESMLRIEPTFFTGGDNNVSTAWGTFRDIANIAFVILLLVVIFSQITGVGINNYGIKKILPKMIVAAILINLSYVICQIAIDLSNILGNGLQNMFESMGEPLASGLDGSQIKIGEGALTVDGVIANAVLPGAALLGGVAAVAAIFTNPFILVSVLVSAISMLISLFFLFLLLVARKAAVIVLVALSPLAFVCYMLPNTKSLFDKWLKGMEGLLLLYPICGLIVGGGGYVSKLLLSTPFGDEGFVQVFAAMVVGIIPIFFIPTLLKNSFAAIGNIGAKISGIGQGLGKGATGAVRNTDAYKNAQEIGNQRNARIRAGINKKGELTAIGKAKARFAKTRVGRMTGYANTLAGNVSSANKGMTEQAMAQVGVAPLTAELAESRAVASRQSQELKNYADQYGTLTQAQMNTELQSAVASYQGERNEQNATRLQAAIMAAESRGMNKEMLGALSDLNMSASNGKDARILGQLATSKNRVVNQYGKQMSKNSAESSSMREFVGGTGPGSMNGAFGDIGSGALVGMDDDTLGYIRQNGSPNSVSAAMLLNAATAASNDKELKQINEMLRHRDDIAFASNEQFASLDSTTVDALAETNSGRNALLAAADNIPANSELWNKVDPEVKRKIEELRRQGAGGDGGAAADAGAAGGAGEVGGGVDAGGGGVPDATRTTVDVNVDHSGRTIITRNQSQRQTPQ